MSYVAIDNNVAIDNIVAIDNNIGTIYDNKDQAEQLLATAGAGCWLFRRSSYNADINWYRFKYANTEVLEKCNKLTGTTVVDFSLLYYVFGDCTAYAVSLKTQDKIIHWLIIETKYGFLTSVPNHEVIIIEALCETFSDLVDYLGLNHSLKL